ncbi:hypothetical protein ILYODFUR_038967 [Ilyodon furcidens]|uniref:Uncharacterized protein n=1 Tax=Ilyodon furcidens TaxID=33524 RepID=A0ABV0T656_9TELE
MWEDQWLRLQYDPKDLLWKLSQILRINYGNHVICGRPSLEPSKEPLPLDSSLRLALHNQAPCYLTNIFHHHNP